MNDDFPAARSDVKPPNMAWSVGSSDGLTHFVVCDSAEFPSAEHVRFFWKGNVAADFPRYLWIRRDA